MQKCFRVTASWNVIAFGLRSNNTNVYEIIDSIGICSRDVSVPRRLRKRPCRDVVILQAVAETLRRLCAVYSRVTWPPRGHIPTHNWTITLDCVNCFSNLYPAEWDCISSPLLPVSLRFTTVCVVHARALVRAHTPFPHLSRQTARRPTPVSYTHLMTWITTLLFTQANNGRHTYIHVHTCLLYTSRCV